MEAAKVSWSIEEISIPCIMEKNNTLLTRALSMPRAGPNVGGNRGSLGWNGTPTRSMSGGKKGGQEELVILPLGGPNPNPNPNPRW